MTVTVETWTPPSAHLRTDDYNWLWWLAVGENSLWVLGYQTGGLYVFDFKEKTITESSGIRNLYTNGARFVPITVQRKRNGNLLLECLITHNDESIGSKNLYFRRFTIDTTDLTVSADSEITLTGSADLGNPSDYQIPRKDGPTVLISEYTDSLPSPESRILIVDLNDKTYTKRTIETSYNKTPYLQTMLRDKTTDYLYYAVPLHYWIVGSYNVICLVDPKTMSAVATNTSIDTGNGSAGVPSFYRDTNGVVRYLYYGTSGALSYPTKVNSLYVDNGDFVCEFTRTLDSSYQSASSGCVEPWCLGTTTDGKLLWLFHARSWAKNTQPSSSFTAGFTLTKTANDMSTPSIEESQTYSITTSDYVAGHNNFGPLLLEDDWCYRLIGLSVNDGSEKQYVGKIDVTTVTIDDENPYNNFIVPTSGLIPTTLTLTVTKV